MKVTLRLFALVLGLSLLTISHVQAEAAVTFYHHDALGSVIATSDQDGYIDLNEEYQPYGEKIYQAEDFNGGNEDWYTGKNFSKELDLTYFWARWYDAKQGRFLSIDPAGVVFENPHSFNRYIYAYNNPYKYIDPDGLAPEAEDANGDGVPDIEEIETFTLGASKQFNDGTHRIAGAFLGGANGRIPVSKNVPKRAPDSTVVCRGGACKAESFTNGSGVTTDAAGKLSGVSTGIGDSVAAASKNIPHNKVGVTTAGDIRAAGGSVVNDRGNHANVSGITAGQAAELFKNVVKNPNR